MASPLDYLRWRDDSSFKQGQYNNIDGTILAFIAYLPFDESIVGHNLKEACEHILTLYSGSLDLHRKTETRLSVKNPCFAGLKILDWTSRLEAEPVPLQFAALALQLNKNTILISFRGTDSSVVGWNEDIIMNYSYQVYGQTVVRDYLEAVADKFKSCKIHITGHSKGGHYAIHSLAAARYGVQDRVVSALNFDGPGCRSVSTKSADSKRAIDKMRTYAPESSIFGIMLDHPERTLVVKSIHPMMHQYIPLNWSVGRNSFVLAEELTTSARIIWHALVQFNQSTPAEKRGQLWPAISLAFESMDIADMDAFTKHRVRGTWTLGKVVMDMDPEVHQVATEMIKLIYQNARNNYLPFSEGDFSACPKSNDSSEAPIFFESYNSKD